MPCCLSFLRCCFWTLALALLALAGCEGGQPAPPAAVPQANSAKEVVAQPAVQVPPAPAEPAEPAAPREMTPLAEPEDGGKIVEEAWDAHFVQGHRVGYAHTTVAKLEEDGRPLVRTRSASRMVMKRAGQTTEQDMLLTSWETPAGELVRFETRLTTGPGQMVTTGKVADGKLAMSVQSLGKTQEQSIPWKTEWGGFFTLEQSLKARPLLPGEKRTIRGLLPLFHEAGDTHLTARAVEEVSLGAEMARLLRVDAVIEMGGQKLDTTFWLDEAGRPLKSLVPAIQQETIRTTREEALRAGDVPFDLLDASSVKLKGKLPRPLETTRAVYRAHVSGGQLEGVFAQCLSQQVKPIDEQTAEITVLATRPDQPNKPDIEQLVPSAEDRDPNNLIQSDDPLIRQMAAQGSSSSAPAKIALDLEKFVAASIKKKNFSQAFASAGEVVRSLEGDCTEHAVLLAALLRVRKIPARVAIGLVYYPPQEGFAFHMWTEAWIGDRWLPLDGTLGRGGIGADHIKLADSSLAGATAYSAMLPVVQVFGRLELEVLEVEH